MTVWIGAPAQAKRAGAPIHLSSFKGLLSVNAMDSLQLKRTRALADLKSRRSGLLADIAAMETKVLFYASECSDGPAAYAAEMSVHINRAKVLVGELDVLIAQFDAAPVQLELLAS